MSVRIDPVTEFGAIEKPLRNIRASLVNEALTLDLIPETTRLVARASETDLTDVERRIVFGGGDVAREVVESDKCLRVHFGWVLAWTTYDESAGVIFPKLDLSNWPRLGDTAFYYPFVRVLDSPWLETVPEYRLPTEGRFVHYSILSATFVVNIIAQELDLRCEWVKNIPSD